MNCTDINVIPQYRNTCWFNAVLMSSLYSQQSRLLLKKLSKDWDKTNQILMIIKSIIYKYYKADKSDVQKFYEKYIY
jgi:hypothetical protein